MKLVKRAIVMIDVVLGLGGSTTERIGVFEKTSKYNIICEYMTEMIYSRRKNK